MSSDEMKLEVSAELEARALDARIQQELDRVPDLSMEIPSDFAARVAAKVPARREIPEIRSTNYGRTFTWAGLVVLLAVLVVLSAQGFVRSTVGLAIEWTLFVQFLAIAVWLGARLWRSS